MTLQFSLEEDANYNNDISQSKQLVNGENQMLDQISKIFNNVQNMGASRIQPSSVSDLRILVVK